MSLLGRLSVFLVAAGLIVGWIARARFGQRRRRLLVALSFLPWLVHLGYLLAVVLRRASLAPASVLGFAAVSLILGAAAALAALGWRGRPVALALVPVALAALYLVGPVWWLSGVLGRTGHGLDAIPAIVLAGGSLFAGAVLAAYLLRLPGPRGRLFGWLRRG